MRQIVQGEMGGVLPLLLPGDRTVPAGAAEESRTIGLFDNFDRCHCAHYSPECENIAERLFMTRRLISLAAMGLFTVALYAANKPVTVALKDAMGNDVG